ncbi:primosomal protein N' [Actinomyces radicidentis]|uniref:primosomal protein N' family DNA-binding protein n=1 Tax=Actinomyces radicidentis TaxID=111015 RepID=UPI0028E63BF2|nr:primosomal protein N' [Actinomyces radicidentis]
MGETAVAAPLEIGPAGPGQGVPGQGPAGQGALLAAPAPAEREVTGTGVDLPVARVLLDTPVPHLDRPFDYLVPPELDVAAGVGTRVTVRFGGQEMHGWVWERSRTTTHPGRLTALRRVVSDLPVLPEATRRLVDAVAVRAAGVRSDVIRLAVPARHATTERSERDKAEPEPPTWTAPEADAQGWGAYEGGAGLLTALAGGGAPRAAWSVLPEREGLVRGWVALVAEAAAASLASGRGVLVIVATTDQAEAVAAALAAELDGEPVVTLAAEHGPARRYRAFLRLLLGHTRVAVGTRAAAFAPVRDLGLMVLWDDGDDRLDERHAPYVHARTVLALRSGLEGAGLLLAAHSRSVEAQSYVEAGWAGDLRAPRALVRRALPRVEVPGEIELGAEGASGRARIPSLAHRAVREALADGPVLVQVPRGGYAPVVACARCRTAARCPSCAGPLSMDREGRVTCRWCGRLLGAFACASCGNHALRMVSVGSARTAEELGRAFPGVPVVVSGARESHGIIDEVDDAPRLVVATPGAEPTALGGYRAALLLDGAALSARPDLGAVGEAMRRWSNAVVLVQPGARVILLGGAEPTAAQALVRWDQPGLARRELAERAELHLPPAWRTARLDGPRRAVDAVLAEAAAAGYEVLGPVEAPPVRGQTARAGEVRGLVRAPVSRGRELAALLRVRSRERSARREEPLRVELDPTVLW